MLELTAEGTEVQTVSWQPGVFATIEVLSSPDTAQGETYLNRVVYPDNNITVSVKQSMEMLPDYPESTVRIINYHILITGNLTGNVSSRTVGNSYDILVKWFIDFHNKYIRDCGYGE